MKGTFNQRKKLEKIKTSNWDTSKVSDFQQTFMGLEVITDFDISNIDFTSATITDRMFADTPTINGILNFNGTKVTNYTNLFTMQSRITDPDFHRENPIIINYIQANESLVDTTIV